MPYTADKPPLPETPQQLRDRIPGWGADLDPADRPAVPREVRDPATGAHWDLPEQQEERRPRERSIEHARLTPVFGTAAPTRGLSGVIRRFSYRRFGEGRTVRWLLLIAADRVDAVEGRLTSSRGSRPEAAVTGTEPHRGPSSTPRRPRPRRSPLGRALTVGSWVLAGVLAGRAVRRMAGRRAGR